MVRFTWSMTNSESLLLLPPVLDVKHFLAIEFQDIIIVQVFDNTSSAPFILAGILIIAGLFLIAINCMNNIRNS